jgi:hypothetical protein
MQDAGEWFGEASSFDGNFMTNFVERFGRRKVEFGQPAVPENSQRSHILASVCQPNPAVFAQTTGNVRINHYAIADLHVDHLVSNIRYCSNVLVAENTSGSRWVAGWICQDVDVCTADTYPLDA